MCPNKGVCVLSVCLLGSPSPHGHLPAAPSLSSVGTDPRSPASPLTVTPRDAAWDKADGRKWKGTVDGARLQA